MKGSRTAGIFPGMLAGLMALALAACSGSNSGNNSTGTGALRIIDQVFTPSDSVTAGQTPTVSIAIDVVDDSVPNQTNSPSWNVTWSQLSGPSVPLNGVNSFQVSFTVPQPSALAATDIVELQVLVSTGSQSVTRTFLVEIIKPTNSSSGLGVDAGPDLIVNSEDVVSLTASVTPAGSNVSYSWIQTAGPLVQLSAPNARQTGFVAPAPSASAPSATQVLEFEVTVDDGAGMTDTDDVRVSVLPLPLAARPASVFVAQNGSGFAGTIQKMVESMRGSQNLVSNISFASIENEGLALDILGNAVHIGDDAGDSGGISFLCRMSQRVSQNQFSEDIDRNVLATDTDNDGDIDNNTTLDVGPGAKGVTLLHEAGYAAVADFNDQQLKLFGLGVTGNIGPVSAVTLGAKPWDVAYDAARDIMYVAATNGTVRILEGYLSDIEAGQQPTETRTLRLLDAAGNVVGRNLHGIAYEPVGDRLVITDVGAVDINQGSNFASDGKLYVLGNVAGLSGDVRPVIISNAALGNPVDVAIWGRDVLVAEKENDQLLLYKNVFTSSGGSIPPDASFPITAPESVAVEFELNLPANGSDQLPLASGASSLIDRVVLMMDTGSRPLLHRLDAGLGEQLDPPTLQPGGARINAGALAVDVTGDAFVASFGSASTFPPAPAPARLDFISRLASTRALGLPSSPADTSAARDRGANYGSNTLNGVAIDQPVAADLAQALGLLFIADSAGEIHVLSTCAEGAILASVELDDGETGAEVPTDIDFDEATGDLYVSLGGSQIAVYRDFHLNYTNNPTAIYIDLEVLDNGSPVAAASNLKAIEYVAGADTLILSDLGAASDARIDGALIMVKAASNMGTSELVDVIISGSASELAEPVDIAFDGKDLLVLDSKRKRLSRYPDILNVSSGSLAPALSPTALDTYTGEAYAIALVPKQTSATPAQLLRP